MNSDSWSIVLSVLGLFLGFISAYGQIKGFFLRLLRYSASSIAEWSNRQDRKVTILATYPSALVAYLARSGLFIAATALAAYALIDLLQDAAEAPGWMVNAVKMLAAAAIGCELGAVHPTVIAVSKRAFRLGAPGADG